jgi:Mrp family chromosome partitioning ATPase
MSKKNEKQCATCNDAACDSKTQRPGEQDHAFAERQQLAARMCQIKRKIMVLSGKGGVGKSTVAVNLAVGLAKAGNRVGLLDVDIHGPSVPKLLHLEGSPVSGDGTSISPVKLGFRTGMLSVMSIAFLLPSRDDAVIWRGPRKYGVIKQFLSDVAWGELDYLVIDAPPGTGDEPLAVAQLVEKADGAVVVTTPQDVAVQDVRRCIVFCRQLSLPVIGVVENMSGFTCPKCGEVVRIFGADGGRLMADEMGVPYLGAIPIEPEVASSGDNGEPVVQAQPDSETARAFTGIVTQLLESPPAAAEAF